MILIFLIALAQPKAYDSSIRYDDAVHVTTRAVAVGRDDGLHAISFTVSNKGKEKVLIVLGNERRVLEPGKSTLWCEATLDGYKEHRAKMKVYVERNGKWEHACSGLATVLK